jgi:hypothetical protein
MAPRTPIIVGIADIINCSTSLADAREPADLMHDAIAAALFDTDNPTQLLQKLNSIDVVATWTWPYPDLPGLLLQKLGVRQTTVRKHLSPHGGNQPALLLDEAAKRIALGETEVAVVTGGEALASCAFCSIPKPGKHSIRVRLICHAGI